MPTSPIYFRLLHLDRIDKESIETYPELGKILVEGTVFKVTTDSDQYKVKLKKRIGTNDHWFFNASQGEILSELEAFAYEVNLKSK